MAKIVQKKFKWDPIPETPDHAGYRVYVAREDEVLDYNSPYAEVDKNTLEVKIPDDFPEDANITEGIYQIGVTPFDNEGNEPDMFVVTYPFDFSPPPMVTAAEVVDV